MSKIDSQDIQHWTVIEDCMPLKYADSSGFIHGDFESPPILKNLAGSCQTDICAHAALGKNKRANVLTAPNSIWSDLLIVLDRMGHSILKS